MHYLMKKRFFGSTTHLIDDKIDCGKIIDIKKLKLKKKIIWNPYLKKLTNQCLIRQLELLISWQLIKAIL